MPAPLPSRFGFGTSGIMGAALTRSGRLRLLETALDHGIHHFDTAPLYGQGEAEALLGHFVRSRRDRLTLTTKFGLLPPQRPALLRPLLPVARVLNRRLWIPWRQRAAAHSTAAAAAASPWDDHPAPPTPDLPCAEARTEARAEAKAMGSAREAAAARPAEPPIPYTPANLRQQLERSLRALQSECIDYYLLHECQPSYLNDDLLACLEALVQEGKIRHYGLGGERGPCRQILEADPGRRWIVQIPDRWHDRGSDWFARHARPPLFTHSALRLGLADGDGAAQRLRQRWAELNQQDPEHPGLLAELLLAIALGRNPHGCVIFSSRHASHIRANADLPARAARLAPALEQLLREMGGEPLRPPALAG